MTAARQAASRNPQARARLTAEEILDPSLPCLILATIVVRGHDARQRHSSEIARALRVSRALVCAASTDAARKNSAQSHDVVSKVDDVFVADRLSDRSHVAGIVGARTRFEVAQLLDDIVGMLSCHSWNLVLALELAEMAHGAEHLFRLLAPAIDAHGISLECNRLGRL